MAFPLYSERFIGATNFTTTQTFVCPAGYRCVVRCITGVNDTGPGSYLLVAIALKALIFYTTSTVSPNSVVWNGRVVFNAGETLEAVSSAGGWDCTVSGYQLVLP